MPYIAKEDRNRIINGGEPQNCGELNYMLTRIVDNYLIKCVQQRGTLKYEDINEVIGAMDCAKLELYRRVAASYEDVKVEQNGDVYHVPPKTHPAENTT